MNELAYPQYSYKPEYEGHLKTFGGFGILGGRQEDRPAVLIKQRNGGGGSKYMFDLPGGGSQPEDLDIGRTAVREVHEEVRVVAAIVARIGSPLWMAIRKDG